ncbi:MAG: GNAT family N-acetyltransferase [Bacillota bacterium]
MELWLEDKGKYQLNENLYIVKAEKEEFSIYESVYGDGKYNRYAVKNWDLRLAVSLDTPFARNDSFYWIFKKDTKIGGVLIEPNVISRLFFIVPFKDYYKVIKLLKKLLIKWSDPAKNIYAFQINNEQGNYFEMLGFWKEKSRCWMMRPTEEMDYKCDLDLEIKNPKKEDSKEIAKLLNLSFENGVDKNSQLNKSSKDESLNNWLETVDDFFDNTNEFLIEASSIIYDTNRKMIGVCLISIFENWPLIHTIALDPLYSGKGIGRIMLKKGISTLNKNYSVVRLFVTKGNSAESMYYELGFVQGVEFSKYYLAKDNI